MVEGTDESTVLPMASPVLFLIKIRYSSCVFNNGPYPTSFSLFSSFNIVESNSMFFKKFR